MKLWWLVVLCACSKHDQAAPPAPAPGGSSAPSAPAAPAKPAAPTTLKATFAGTPVTFTEAYIKRTGPRGHSMFLTDNHSSCQELMDSLYSGHDGEHTLLVEMGKRLAPDGTLTGLVTQYHVHGPHDPKPGSKAVVGDNGEVALDVSAGDIEVHGTVKPQMCGDDVGDKSGIPKAQHPSSAKLTVAGHDLPLVGAIVRGDYLMLSSGPKDCSSTTQWAEAIVERDGGTWKLHGEWLAQEAGNYESPDPKTAGIKIQRGAKGKSEDGPTVQLDLSGSGKIGDYPVALAGTIEALDCPK